jgi:hypothetical protein
MVSNRSNGIYRSVVTATVGLIIVATAIWFLIRDLSTIDSTYRHTATDASVEYQRNAQAYIKEYCFSPAGLREEDCTAKAYEAAREGQRKEQDLAAQNITAWWTKVMGIAALIGMALSAVGVWLVKATFDATRRSNEIARTVGEAQVRCYLSIKSPSLKIDMYGQPEVDIVVFNSGQSPARKFRWTHSARWRCRRPEIEWESLPLSEPSLEYLRDITVGDNKLPTNVQMSGRNLTEGQEEGLARATVIFVNVTIWMLWEDVFGNEFSELWNFQAGHMGGCIDNDIPLHLDTRAVERPEKAKDEKRGAIHRLRSRFL